LVKQAPSGSVPPELLHDVFKGIVWQLDGLKFNGLPEIGGGCIYHALAAYQAVRANGVDASIGFGSLLARIGPDPYRDVIAFSNANHMGEIGPDGRAVFHCWVRHGDWIFDASLPDWKRLDPVASEIAEFGTALPPPQWSLTLPRCWFKHREEVELAWRLRGTPELGKAWYGPWFGDPEPMMARIRQVHVNAGPQIANGLARIFNGYCDSRGIPRQHDDQIYPIKFEVITDRKEEERINER
jgi:hypothetical protein